MYMLKIRGERIQPRRRPVRTLNQTVLSEFTRTDDETNGYRELIARRIFQEIPTLEAASRGCLY
jgi:hypothetical protein